MSITKLQRLATPEALRPYASISEQILMSGSNMLASLVVVSAAGVEQFGIYSFVFVLTTLANGVFSSLLHRQMMLDISAAENQERHNVFAATLALELLFMAGGTLILLLVFWLLGQRLQMDTHLPLLIASVAYVCLNNIFDLFKQYLYTTDNQVYSLRCTVIYIAFQFLGLAWIMFGAETDETNAAVYLLFALSLLASLAMNKLCREALKASRWLGWSYISDVFKRYFKQGRFSLQGMTLTWLQNQSINPILMLISGPLVVGYFSLARLMVMPLSVVNQGLVNSSTPALRRVFQNKGADELTKNIASLNRKNLIFSAFYISILAVAHVTGLLERFVPSYEQVKWYLLLWIVMISVMIYRFWLGQFFVVSMRFKFLLFVSVIALAVTMSGMLVFGVLLSIVPIALLFVIVGELVTIGMFKREHRRSSALKV